MARLSGRPLLDTRADAALFVDRRPELDRLTRAGNEGLNVLVSGPRGLGRTSLLRRLAFLRREEGGALAFLDAAGAPDPGAFLRGVAHALGLPPAPAGPAADAVIALAATPPAPGTVLAVDGLPAAVAQAVFGQLRDEIWGVPLTWLVSCAAVDEPAFLRPPADAFFDTTLHLPALACDDVRDLLRRRSTEAELDDEVVTAIAGLAGGSPRRALDLARHLLLAPAGDGPALGAARDRLLHREQAVERLGMPARMLLAELDTSGGASASDERLLARLGWTRARAAQVLRQLEDAGLVEATDQPRATGRPRRIYRSKDWVTGAPQ